LLEIITLREGIFWGWGWENIMTPTIAIAATITPIRTSVPISSDTACSESPGWFMQINY
jgi:hypothetical protein